MINIENVSKYYGSKPAVKDISFHAKKGEIIGFLGPNGAGKTTTMRLILGLIHPTSGRVLVDGQNPIAERLDTLPMLGYLPENNPLYPEMKVREYLRFIAQVKQDSMEHTEEIVRLVNVGEVLDSKIEELSRGFKQRVGLAAALLGNPEILILDEPTSGLDPLEQDKIKDLIQNISKEKTVLFSTHVLSEVEDIATRLIIIKDGSIVYDGKKPSGRGEVDKLFKNLMIQSSLIKTAGNENIVKVTKTKKITKNKVVKKTSK